MGRKTAASIAELGDQIITAIKTLTPEQREEWAARLFLTGPSIAEYAKLLDQIRAAGDTQPPPGPVTWAVRGYEIDFAGQGTARRFHKFTVTAIDQADAVAKVRERYGASGYDIKAISAYAADYLLSMTNATSTVHVNGCPELDNRARVAGWPYADGFSAMHVEHVAGHKQMHVHDCVRKLVAAEARSSDG